MAEGKNLKATSDAAEAIGSVIAYDAGAPLGAEMAQVSGVRVGPAADYARTLASISGVLRDQFAKRLASIHADLQDSKFSIEQMQSFDQDIATMLQGLDSDSAGTDNPRKQWG